ncbi:beta-N-acetylhexosaminidase [Flavihumibacter profundi]|uniref:beta-N-acetylhexosaminidase n=1 Tax=Flavihumibacter profundi TaxID=2716883 RepID=UPI001CC80B19|nr:family 20 glycosylhydrolase [Flavihumibacter profundi]MBZ5856019.1 family 20 glycosylhydrolase [Flavihumibacter profundi]
MRKTILLLVFCIALVHLFAQDNTYNLMPVPRSLKTHGNSCAINKQFTIGIIGHPGDRVYKEASRALRRLDNRMGFFFTQGNITPKDSSSSATLLIDVKRKAELNLQEDESYHLITGSKQVKITANTDLGAIRALETLQQLVSVQKGGYYFPGVEIYDEPRFPWRGLLLDITLHWMPMDVVKRTLDAMAAVKLNVFHMHLTEDQLFGIESKVYPRLTSVGAEGNFYTQENIKEIIAYADQRGIRIVPEFDVPGHCTAMLKAYPQLASVQRDYELQRYYGVFDPALDVTKPYTYAFLDTLFTEMAALFPDEYFHIGGDENTGKDWDRNPEIKAYMQQKGMTTYRELETEFISRLLPILKKNGKKMMGWDEIFRPGVPHDIMIQSWRGLESLVDAARQGYTSLLSTGYYIDLIQPTDYHYLVDPVPVNTPLTKEEQKFIVGGEATMWTEHVTPETVDSRIWPRTAAIAERLWSSQSVNNVDDMYRRLDKIDLYLEGLGTTQLKNKGMLMRRLVNGYNTQALEVLVNVIEPLKLYERNEGDTMYTVFSPYTKIADVATPDQKTAREFRKLVAAFCQSKDAKVVPELRKSLELWKNNDVAFQKLIQQSPVLKEAANLSEHLAQIAKVGIEALQFITSGKKPPLGWETKSLQITKKAKEQGGRCELQVVTAIEQLVKTAL